MINRREVETSPTYFREYGMHAVKQRYADREFIASFPTWEDTVEALRHMPPDGNVITPELATMSGNPYETDLIATRVSEAKFLTLRTDATLYLGTPTYDRDPRTRQIRPLNSVHAIHRGEIIATTHKRFLTDPEMDLKFMRPETDKRRALGGNAVTICVELMDTKWNQRLQTLAPKRLFVPARWALQTEQPTETFRKFVEEAGGENNYYMNNLETVVGRYALTHLPSVQRVIVADAGRPDLPPYNAVFDRIA